MKTFQGRVVTPGCAQAEALVSHGGLNTPVSYTHLTLPTSDLV